MQFSFQTTLVYVYSSIQAREHIRRHHSYRRQFVGGLYLQKQYGVIILPAHPSPSRSKSLKKIASEHRGRGDQRIHHYPVVGQQALKRGQLLVELSPKFYEITSFTNGQLRDVTSSSVTLPKILHLTPENFRKLVFIIGFSSYYSAQFFHKYW